jgi:hypothetical protein
MRVEIYPHDYRFMTPSGEVMQSGSASSIGEVVRVVAELSGFPFSYQVVHRALRGTGIWLGSYRPEPGARPVVLVIERSPESFNQLPAS